MRVGFGLILALVCLGCSAVDLQGGLDEQQANRALVALDQAGIPAEKVKEEGGRTPTYRIRVAGSDVARSLKVLEAHGLPHDAPKGVVDLMAQPSLIPTATQERAVHLAALAGELSRTLETIDGVFAARVHLSLPEDNPLKEADKRPQPGAAVLLKTRPGTTIATEDIQRLVAGSVEGLDPSRVSVVVTLAQAMPQGSPGDTLAHVGPFAVARSSRTPLLVTLVGALLIIMGLAAALIAVALRASRASRRASETPLPPVDVVEHHPGRATGAVSLSTRSGRTP